MGAITNFVLGGVAERLSPMFQTPVEDIIYEVLDQKGLPTRSEVRELRNKLDRLEKSLEGITDAIEALKGELGAVAEAASKAAVAAPGAQAVQGAVAPRPSACRVPDCGGKLRAKGFCAKHYQKWKRGTLDGFVSADGTTAHGDVTYRVDEAAAGQLVETSYEGDEVIFSLPEAGRTVRHKVNDARID